MSELIQTRHENGVAYIMFKRADKFNSFVREMALELQNQLKKADKDDSIRAIVLTGDGKAFCAGQDLKEAADDNGIELQKIVSEHYNPVIKLIRAIEKPVIAAVNGVAAGAGANIALSCDIVIATESASFIQAFSKIGLIPDSGGTFFLPRLVGMQKATALMMLGDKVSAKEAEDLNMIYKAVPDADFNSEIEKTATKLAKMPTKGLGLTKKLLNESWANDLSQQLQREDDIQTEAGQTHDYNEGVQAFLEKRKPNFTGK
ncbi:MAG: enoyl-CoA hydratase-related protein [Salibacter sp.]|uniref:enoyl-CoA hydratase-related protein n=1 Tax=Salibacter sp. TaxID=2010995 RepID=UPI0028701C4F|nr:enoyl-CoA hydratase-related protein [Salibacter sp.]MDR9398635.1 enoyl-CoA hydratase-related protein [Salibacter sp.]